MTVIRQSRPEPPATEEPTAALDPPPLLARWADLPALITVQDAADLLGLSRSTAYRAAERGELPVIRFGGRMRVPVARLLVLMGLLDRVPATPPAGQHVLDDHAADDR